MFLQSSVSIHTHKSLQYLPAVYIIQFAAASPFRVRHHTEHISAFIADTCDVIGSAVGVRVDVYFAGSIAVAKYNLVVV